MDYIKYPYKAMMRNKDGTTFPVQWLIANPDALDFPYVTPFVSSRWEPEQNKYAYWLPYVDFGYMGEVPERSPAKSVGFITPGVSGQHICGTQDQWENGFDTPFDSSPFAPDGWPLCCKMGAEFNDDYNEDYWI